MKTEEFWWDDDLKVNEFWMNENETLAGKVKTRCCHFCEINKIFPRFFFENEKFKQWKGKKHAINEKCFFCVVLAGWFIIIWR